MGEGEEWRRGKMEFLSKLFLLRIDRCAPDWKPSRHYSSNHFIELIRSIAGFVCTIGKEGRNKDRERERSQRSDVLALVEDVNEAGGEDTATLRVVLDVAFHPVVVFRFFDHNDEDLPFTEGHLIVVVRLAVVQRATSATCNPIKHNAIRIFFHHWCKRRENLRTKEEAFCAIFVVRILLPRGSCMGDLSLNSPSEGAEERLSVDLPLKRGCEERITAPVPPPPPPVPPGPTVPPLLPPHPPPPPPPLLLLLQLPLGTRLIAGVGGGGPRGRLEPTLLVKLVAEPWSFRNCGSSPLGSTNLAPTVNPIKQHFSKIIPTLI